MFTGIITDIGHVRALVSGGDTRLEIMTSFDMTAVPIGSSIACSGICLTVIDSGPDWFAVSVSGETVARSTAAHWQTGSRINLERPLRVGDELGGHMVTGHVDGVGTVVAISEEGDSHRVSIEAPDVLARFIAEKGSVAVDGVSLTVNTVEGRRFNVNIIPHTWMATTFGDFRVGTTVNLEIDLIARYVARLLASS